MGIDQVTEPGTSFDQFDENRILQGQVTHDEKVVLETKLIHMYKERAKELGRKFVIITNRDHYESLRESGELFDGPHFYLHMEEGEVMDMVPVTHHLLDTPEGNFYAKLITPHDGCRQP